MRTREVRILVYEYETVLELSEADRQLVFAAREVSEKAYAPYSGFQVGAALTLENGEIITGNNQENADFTDGLCAERVALFTAHSQFPETAVTALAITAKNARGLTNEPAKPCGSCRQAMVETEVRFNHPIRIILDGKKKIQVFEGVDNLLPFAFKPDSLG